jgi:sulfate adenylyltransferase
MTKLIKPYGGKFIDLLVPPDARESMIDEANRLPSIQLTRRAICDLELLAIGAFSPLDGFMRQADYESVLATMRLANGSVFPIPVTLPVDDFDGLKLGKRIALRDERNDLLAVMTVEEIYEWSRRDFALQVLGTDDFKHPLVTEIQHWRKYNIAGRLQVIDVPKHTDFQGLRLTPKGTREALASLGHENVVAFQTRNPIHRAHEALTKRAAESVDGTLLLHPVVGMTKPGDVDYFTRVRTYQTLAQIYYESTRTLLSLLPLAMRMAGPREAVWHAIIRRNYGANHFIVGRDHASPGVDSKGRPFYAPDAAKELATSFSDEIGIKILTFDEMVYLEDEDRYEERTKVPKDKKILSLSGTQIRDEYLGKSKSLPAWFTRPEVAEILASSYPPPAQQGFCVWFTGLSGAGKSATAELLTVMLNEKGRRVTVLDGDVVRTHLSKGLGFSREDRDANILRIAFVAAEIVRHGGAVICAAVSPYRATRNEARQMIGDNFIEVFVDTPLDVCESRDAKGMYAKARRGEITGFTGIDDPYEPPENAEITLETVNSAVEANSRKIFDHLAAKSFIKQ